MLIYCINMHKYYQRMHNYFKITNVFYEHRPTFFTLKKIYHCILNTKLNKTCAAYNILCKISHVLHILHVNKDESLATLGESSSVQIHSLFEMWLYMQRPSSIAGGSWYCYEWHWLYHKMPLLVNKAHTWSIPHFKLPLSDDTLG